MTQPKTKLRSKTERVLTLLLKGREIVFPDVGKVSMQDGRLALHLTSYSPKHPDGVEKLVDITNDVTFGGFIKMAESLSEDEIFILVSEQVLTEFNQERDHVGRDA